MIYRFLFVVLILSAAGCVQPVVTATPAASLSPSPSATAVPTDTALPTLPPTAAPTETETPIPTPTIEPSFTPTPRPTRIPPTSGPTPSADTLAFEYPLTITVVPWALSDTPPVIRCLLLNYDFTWEPGKITITRRDKAAYFECLAKET